MRAPTAIDQANQLVRHLGDQIGIPSLCLDDLATCQLLVARRWVVTFSLDAVRDTLYLSCPITQPEQASQLPAGAWLALLQSQHMGGKSPDATVAADALGRVCLQQALHLPTALPGQLVTAVEVLLGRASQWTDKLAQASASAAAAPLPAPPASRLHQVRI